MANIIKTTLEDANDVLTYNNRKSFPSSGESGKLYIAADTKYTYFWNGSSYVETSISDITDLYKQEYNLGYYDTITANSDGTYTITRQTGYLVLDGSEDGWGIYLQGLWAYIKVYNIIPVTNQNNVGQFITNRGPAVSITTMMYTSSGIQIAQDGESINIRPNVSSINSLDTFKQWLSQNNIAIQYKLATATTEKVEANHYSAYNQDFILEHNKSEAERSANLFNPNNVEYGSINGDGTNLENGTARARTFYLPVLANTYYSIRTNNSELLVYELYQYDSNKSHIEPYTSILNDTFTFLTRNNTYYIRILFRNTSNTDFNLDILSRVMLNYGTTPLLYQPYNQNKHITNNEAEFLKTESDRSANLFSGGVSLMDKGLIVGKQYIITTKNKTIYNFKIATQSGATAGSGEILNSKDNTSAIIFTWNANKNWNLYVFDTNWVLQNNDDIQIMLNEGSTPLPYQQYEGKVVHEKELENYTRKTIKLSDNVNLDTVNSSGFYRLMNMSSNTNFSHSQMIVSRGDDTIAQIVFPYGDTKMYVRTGNPFNTSGGLWHDWKQVAFTDSISTVSKSAPGLCPQLPNETTTTKYLRQDGTWVKPPNTTYIAALNGGLYLSSANAFSLKTATASEIGGVKSSKTGTTANRDYKVQVNDDGTMKVNVPWTDNNTTYSAGTGLSLNTSNNTFSVKTGYTTDANNRNYKVAADSSGNLYVHVPWSSSGTLDTSLSSSSTNALQNKAIYSAFSSAVGYDNNYYAYGENGSWRMKQYNTAGNSLDIRYGVITVNSQSANYNVSFGNNKSFNSSNYTVVFGLYRSNTQSWFWSPIVQKKTSSGFTVFLRGNSGGDNSGTIMYIAIRSN